jgi:hypothetical protein
MVKFLRDSGYEDPGEVCVLTDGALDLVGIAAELPFDSEWVLDWAHIGRLLRYADQAFTPLAYGRL